MYQREDLVSALLSEVAGHLEEATSLAPLTDPAGLGQRIENIERHARYALTMLAAAKAMMEMDQQS